MEKIIQRVDVERQLVIYFDDVFDDNFTGISFMVSESKSLELKHIEEAIKKHLNTIEDTAYKYVIFDGGDDKVIVYGKFYCSNSKIAKVTCEGDFDDDTKFNDLCWEHL